MKKRKAIFITNILGVITFILMSVAAVIMIYLQFKN